MASPRRDSAKDYKIRTWAAEAARTFGKPRLRHGFVLVGFVTFLTIGDLLRTSAFERSLASVLGWNVALGLALSFGLHVVPKLRPAPRVSRKSDKTC